MTDPTDWLWIDSSRELAKFVAGLSGVDRYALDTEFHRERTYFPKLALVQIAWDGGLALIDPVAADPELLKPLLEGDALAVLHAAQQDLDVLTHAVGSVPSRMFDTQLAAGFVGYSTPSLVSLLAAELKVQVPKGDRLTDWLRRPLTKEQQSYAAGDVRYLFEVQDRLSSRLAERGRLGWALDACEELRCRPQGLGDPYDAWLRIKDVRVLKSRSRGVAKALGAWRERRAAASDIPVRQVLADLAVLGVAQRMPRNDSELRSCRGIDERHVRGSFAKELLAAVDEGLSLSAELPHHDGEELDRRLRPAVTLASAWISEIARREQIDTALLATRHDLTDYMAGSSTARLSSGWRQEIVGNDLDRLMKGEAALAFDGKGGMRLFAVDGAVH